MGALNIKAVKENNKAVLDFATAELERGNFPELLHPDILVAIEEIFVNIAGYAYSPETEGLVSIHADINEVAVFRFEDTGRAFNPLEMEDPDLSVPLSERKIGGLGLLFVKSLMDNVKYERIDDKNILTIAKCG